MYPVIQSVVDPSGRVVYFRAWSIRSYTMAGRWTLEEAFKYITTK